MKQIQQLKDKTFIHKEVPEFNLSVEEYSRVLDSVVLANVDIILYQPNGEVLLGRRVDKPLQDELWIFGGRMKPGESINDTAIRNIARELGLEAETERLVFSNIYNIMWPGRAEPPQGHGFQTMISILKYECSLEEAEQATVTDDTHSNLRWYPPEELRELKEKGEFHSYLIAVLTDAGLLS